MHFKLLKFLIFALTIIKAQQDRTDNAILRVENESLKSENFRLQAALRNVACPNCGGPAVLGEISFDEQHLRIDNARLKEEVQYFF
jgi:predicted  nucleic acid-binding Zn ribbon protein